MLNRRSASRHLWLIACTAARWRWVQCTSQHMDRFRISFAPRAWRHHRSWPRPRWLFFTPGASGVCARAVRSPCAAAPSAATALPNELHVTSTPAA